MANREPVQIVEIDVDFCTLEYGVGACTAVLGTDGVRKCYNTWNTCQVQNVYNKGTLTLRFVTPRVNIPKESGTYFPALKSVSAFSNSVNIAGSNPKLGTLGKRGKVSITIEDFPYHDRITDKYASGRVDGTAQTDEGGYNPEDRGTFWTKFKKRVPNYAGRALRVINTFIEEDGTFATGQTRNFIITEIKGPDDGSTVTIEAKDILSLADKKSALAPKASEGFLEVDIDAASTTFDLTPAGIGDAEYPTSGFAVIGSEVVQYTRSSDTITLVGRGLKGTEATSHAVDSTFQQAINYSNASINEVLDDLLTNYTDIDSGFIDSAAYAFEVDRWAGITNIDTIITEPTPVAQLLGELAILGVSLWWDDVSQKIKMRLNHPLDIFFETYTSLNEDNAIKKISQEDRDEERLTQVHFYTVQSDPTQGVTDKSNYDRVYVTVDADAENPNNYGESRVREVFCRWFNQGDDSAVRIISRRLLQRFNRAPDYFHITVDAKDIDLSLVDLIEVTSRVTTDVTGKQVAKRLQITEKSEERAGNDIKLVAQLYDFNDYYGYIMENTANDFGSATDTEKDTGCYIIDAADDEFSDGTPAYRIA